MYDVETETRPRHWSDGIKTRLRLQKNASRPSQDRDYNPAVRNALLPLLPVILEQSVADTFLYNDVDVANSSEK